MPGNSRVEMPFLAPRLEIRLVVGMGIEHWHAVLDWPQSLGGCGAICLALANGCPGIACADCPVYGVVYGIGCLDSMSMPFGFMRICSAVSHRMERH